MSDLDTVKLSEEAVTQLGYILKIIGIKDILITEDIYVIIYDIPCQINEAALKKFVSQLEDVMYEVRNA